MRAFAESEVDPQRLKHDSSETFNRALFGRCGELGLLGVTAPVEHGGAGMDAARLYLRLHKVGQFGLAASTDSRWPRGAAVVEEFLSAALV